MKAEDLKDMVLKEIFEKHILEESEKYIFPLSKILTLKTPVIFKCFKFAYIDFTHTLPTHAALVVISLSCVCVIYMRGTGCKNCMYHTETLPTEIHTQMTSWQLYLLFYLDLVRGV